MKTSSGFTMIELLAVVMIVSILMAIGVPSFRYVTTSNRLSSEINGLLGDMQFARAQAIKEGRTVTVCSSTNNSTCSDTADWSKGWIVFSDPNNDHVVVAGAILRAQPTLAPDSLKDNTNTLSSATFNRMGLLSTPAVAANAITLTLHDKTATPAWTRCLAIVSQGLVTTQTPATAAGCK
ncbi:MAG: GspH/FimT family pseudopilin [Steroidobacteraceae bacterium]